MKFRYLVELEVPVAPGDEEVIWMDIAKRLHSTVENLPIVGTTDVTIVRDPNARLYPMLRCSMCGKDSYRSTDPCFDCERSMPLRREFEYLAHQHSITIPPAKSARTWLNWWIDSCRTRPLHVVVMALAALAFVLIVSMILILKGS